MTGSTAPSCDLLRAISCISFLSQCLRRCVNEVLTSFCWLVCYLGMPRSVMARRSAFRSFRNRTSLFEGVAADVSSPI